MDSDISIRAFSRASSALFAAAFTLVFAAGVSLSSAADQRVRGEYEVKAALVYNFLKFVDWPAKEAGSGIRVCVLGDLSRARPLAGLDDQVVAGRSITVARAELNDVHGCDVLFLLKGEERRIARVLAAVRGGNTLTIGEADGLGRKGVMINFLIERSRVRFEINADAARDAGITISSKLMKLATSGSGITPGGD